MISETKIGRGDRVFNYYTRINPSKREEISDLHRCEPYAYSQMIARKDAPTHGEAKNSYLSGTTAMNYVAISQAILGIQPTYDGLEIRSVVLSGWKGFEAIRCYQDVRNEISVKRVSSGNQVCLEVDGKRISGTIVPLLEKKVTTIKIVGYIGQEKK